MTVQDTHELWYRAQLAAWFFQIVTGLLTVLVLVLSMRTSRKLKAADIRIEDQRRYDQLLVAKHELSSDPLATKEWATAYYERFWNLQSDQFEDWRGGLLSERIFKSWMINRQIEWELNQALVGVTYQAGWHSVKGKFSHNDFSAFIELIVKNTRKDPGNAMKEFGPKAFKQAIRFIFG